jgi:hypothetical protein
MGGGEKGVQGHAFYTAPNPPYGAVFTYHLKEPLKTPSEVRRENERRLVEQNQPVYYPSWDELRVEDREEEPAIVFTVTDSEGSVVRRVTGPTSRGIHRVAWDLRYPAVTPTRAGGSSSGPLAVPGTYAVQMATFVDGVLTPVGEQRHFQVNSLANATLAARDQEALLAFQQEVGRLQRVLLAADAVASETLERLPLVKEALMATPAADPQLLARARSLELRLLDIQVQLTGDRTIRNRAELAAPSLLQRVQRVVRSQLGSTAEVTGTHRRNYEIAAAAFGNVLEDLRQLIEVELVALYDEMELAGAPWTEGRGLPRWRP